jgi:hypothetical protein
MPVSEGKRDLIVLDFALTDIIPLGLINRGADEERICGV